jgi:CPA2 family monovalent cation:H+ antiporter-2
LLVGRGEIESPHARTALGLGVVQDLSLVAMLALLPLLTGEADSLFFALARSLGIAALALIAVVVLGTRLVPRILFAVAKTESRELFILTVVLIALGTAVASHEAGLSLALGAFLAGLVVSESEFDSHVLAEIVPLRDVFSTLFFVSLGMLIEPTVLLENFLQIGALVAVLVVGKTVIIGAGLLTAGVDHRTATLSAVVMAQIGEFSFVLAGVGLAETIIDGEQYGLILEVALGSILLSPLLLRLGPLLVGVASLLPGVARQEASQIMPELGAEVVVRHVVICGFGRVGMVLGESLDRRGLRYTVIDINPAIVRELQARGIRAYYGDAGSDALLLRAGVDRARTIAVTVADMVAARAAIRHARNLNPVIDVITRARIEAEVELLRGVGADEVVQPEFEAGLEFVRHVLRRQGVSARETTALLSHRRASYYQLAEASDRFGEDPPP